MRSWVCSFHTVIIEVAADTRRVAALNVMTRLARFNILAGKFRVQAASCINTHCREARL
jgi:hypothetical protein